MAITNLRPGPPSPPAGGSGRGKFLFSISDTGIGIPKKDQKYIFDKFRRGSNAEQMKKEGFGLGLYTAAKTTELLRGKIWLESEEDKGSIFYVELPLETSLAPL